MSGSNTTVMYGMPPGDSGREWPGPVVPWPPNAQNLVTCPTCKRHIYARTTCPFCFAEQVAKAPSRAAIEAVKRSLEEALKIVNQALESQP